MTADRYPAQVAAIDPFQSFGLTCPTDRFGSANGPASKVFNLRVAAPECQYSARMDHVSHRRRVARKSAPTGVLK